MSNLKDHPYNVVPIVGERGRFFVSSKSRPSQQHVVDLAYVEDGKMKAKMACGCEAFSANKFTKGKACEHIKAVVDYEKKRLGL